MGWQSLIVALTLASASSVLAQASAPSQNAPSAPGAPSAPAAASAPGVSGQAPPPRHPQQAYPAQPQAYPAQPAPQPAQGGYPPAQGYSPPPQQGYPPPQQGYAPPQQGYAPPQQGYAPPQQGYAPQQPSPYQQPYYANRAPRRQRPSRALLITGASIFGGAYLISALVGGILIDEENDYGDCYDCREVGRWLFLPVAGPWIAMKETRDDGGLAFLGLLQLVGAGLTVGGIVRFVNTKRQYESGLASWHLPGDRKLTLDMTSSPLLVGPRMHLQF